jgi:hypothetical protein
MQDNLSLIIAVIILVALIIIFPLYNLFERQDNMSYNLVLKATTNFVDEVKNNGYIDNSMYDNFVKQLANTGNIYNIEIEAHKKTLVLDESTPDPSDYIEKYKIDYNDDIFEPLDTKSNPGVSTNITTDKRILKNSTYLLNKDDQIYVKVKNYSQTMAQTIFKIISPTTDKSKISINYGGVIANNSWKQVDSTYFAHNTRPTITLTSNPDVINNNSINPDTSITFTATSTVSSWWKHIDKYVYTITYTDIVTGIKGTPEVIESTNGILVRSFPQGIYSVTVYSVDSDGEVSKTIGAGFVALQNFMQQAISGVGVAQVESIEISGATISEYTFEVRVRAFHDGNDWWRVTGLTKTGTWENVNPINVANPTVYSDTIKNNVRNGVTTGVKVLPDPNRYVKLKFEYYVELDMHIV